MNLEYEENEDKEEHAHPHWLLDQFPQLTLTQLKYCLARQTCRTKKDAARQAGVEPNTVSKWPPYVEAAVNALVLETLEEARQLRRSKVLDAVQVKVDGLHEGNPFLRQQVATEIIRAEIDTPLADVAARNVSRTPGMGQALGSSDTSQQKGDFQKRLERFLTYAPDDKQAIFLAEYELWAATATRLEAILREWEEAESWKA